MYTLRFKLFWEIEKAARADNEKELKNMGLANRGFDVWKPIIIIAKFFCPERIPELIEYAKYVEQVKKDVFDDETNSALINAIIDVTPKEGWIRLTDIAQRFNQLMGCDEDSHKKRESSSAVFKKLCNLGFQDKRSGTGNYTEVRIDFLALRRYATQVNRHVGPQTVDDSVKAEKEHTLKFRKI